MPAQATKKKATPEDVWDLLIRLRRWWRKLNPTERRILRETIFRP